MREILFKGKRLDNGEWVEGGYDYMEEYSTIYDSLCSCHSAYEVDPETVGQYTGLIDKNRVKIFEGDIVKFGKHTYVINFECGSFNLFDKSGYMITKIGGINDHCYSLMNLYLECCGEGDVAYNLEIIGNIHDNKELMEEVE